MGWVEDKALDRVGEFAWVSFVRFVVVDVVYAERDWKEEMRRAWKVEYWAY
jgi:hypothetical protein